MSISEKMQKNSSHGRNDSQELDVFEAARYFSTSNENQGHYYSQKMIRENFQRPARMSLDMPMMRHAINPPHSNHAMDQRQIKENKKYKQPSSPGGRLASFLNSLFNQTTLKKKKSKSKDILDDEENPVGIRRKRRSSISHFKITSSKSSTIGGDHDDSKSLYNSSINSGFRTPPPYANTPNKSYKEFRNFSEQQKVVSLPKSRGINNLKPTLQNEMKVSSKNNIVGTNWIDEYTSEEREFRKFSDDGADSDSSSDLFDLPNHDLDFYPTGLPVYETTHMDRIKIGAPISTA